MLHPPGLHRRMHRLLPPGRAALWLPLDDGLISGPEHHLRDVRTLLTPDVVGHLTAVLGFRGALAAAADRLIDTPVVMNLSASTTRHEHTRKMPVGTVADAVRAGADAIACHVNVTSPFEDEGLDQLSRRITEADLLGVPVVAMIYPRARHPDGTDDNHLRLRQEDPERFAALVRHCARIAMELGANAIKTIYTGTPETFRTVVESAMGVPVLIAGEALVDPNEALERARGAVKAGASGVAFGRQIFERDDAGPFVTRLRAALDDVAPLSIGVPAPAPM
ncbi:MULTISPECIES: beta/alpha barrel domain-containing protein [Catenuloplanes]|uniref:DhnA family fructose-bisphosphate aldolase class Ia n=1 Tax=Catenuloplanes niger TaxID=587534 RepID=A0AAE4CPX8_9ACTN|nr:hypothetical protein [Catenuloplanes niger]MDR7321101.1 DhnA family fructose-bisphosphate aldolase class Ia [Catenuloplanes niger]